MAVCPPGRRSTLAPSSGKPTRLPELPGDFNLDGTVNSADYTRWRDTLGAMVEPYSGADADGNGKIETADYGIWKSHFGETLESPGSAAGGGSHRSSRPRRNRRHKRNHELRHRLRTPASWSRRLATPSPVTPYGLDPACRQRAHRPITPWSHGSLLGKCRAYELPATTGLIAVRKCRRRPANATSPALPTPCSRPSARVDPALERIVSRRACLAANAIGRKHSRRAPRASSPANSQLTGKVYHAIARFGVRS